jgi:hypothetical protein
MDQETYSNPETETAPTLIKVGRQEGSNEGGWYSSGDNERKYIKFYTDPNQGRMEFIANEVYGVLGIPAVKSEIVEVDGKEGVASKEIPGHHRVSTAEIKRSDDVKNGFVADAFLANWDVVGLVYDNIERGADGRLYRIDSGGVLTFRAQGGEKFYNPDSIGELDTLRNPYINPQSSNIFGELTEADITQQAHNLVENLSDEVIEGIISRAKLPTHLAEVVREGMKGRKEFLRQNYHSND